LVKPGPLLLGLALLPFPGLVGNVILTRRWSVAASLILGGSPLAALVRRLQARMASSVSSAANGGASDGCALILLGPVERGPDRLGDELALGAPTGERL
jgi:hypothetical protein